MKFTESIRIAREDIPIEFYTDLHALAKETKMSVSDILHKYIERKERRDAKKRSMRKK